MGEMGKEIVRTDRDEHGCGSAAIEIEPFFRIHGTENLEDGLRDRSEYL
jgi:hypothetical protein